MGMTFVNVLLLGSVLLFLPSLDATKEVCLWESFNATCSDGEFVFIESAFLGRMSYSRCYNFTEKKLNCSTDIRLEIQTQFEVRQSIYFKLISEFFARKTPVCVEGWMTSLEISYQCIKPKNNEVCVDETFSAACPFGSVIVIQSALYGRIGSSRCTYFDNKDLNCYADVLLYLESLCNGRVECNISASDDELRKAYNDRCRSPRPYLEVFHACVQDDTSSKKKMMIIVPSVTVTSVILLAALAVMFIQKHRQKNQQRKSMARTNPVKLEESEYDLIPYACTDGYDTIEEVCEIDDIVFPNFFPRLGPLPSPGYSGLMPEEPTPPGVYSRMDHTEHSVDDRESDDDRSNPQSNTYRSRHGDSDLSDEVESTIKITSPINSYLVLEPEVNAVQDIPAECNEIPSVYLTIAQESLQTDINTTVRDAVPEYEMPSSYLTTRDIASPINSYLVLEPEVNAVEDIATECDEIPSAYLTITHEPLQRKIDNIVRDAIPEYEIPSSYLTTREIDSSALQK